MHPGRAAHWPTSDFDVPKDNYRLVWTCEARVEQCVVGRIPDRLQREVEGRVPVVGSSMKMTEGLATSSTAIVRRLRCSTLRPVLPGTPTSDPFSGVSSTSAITCTGTEVDIHHPLIGTYAEANVQTPLMLGSCDYPPGLLRSLGLQ